LPKALGMAGARLGYLAASSELVDALRVVRLPYHLSAVSQAVARAALAHSAELMAQVGSLPAERDATVAWLRERGLMVADSDANFALFGTSDDRRAVWQGPLDRGAPTREVGPPGWLLVSVGAPPAAAAVQDAAVEVAGLCALLELVSGRVASSDARASRACSSSSTSTGPDAPRSSRGCRSTTTCSRPSASTPSWT